MLGRCEWMPSATRATLMRQLRRADTRIGPGRLIKSFVLRDPRQLNVIRANQWRDQSLLLA
jgi:hypothetical protein